MLKSILVALAGVLGPAALWGLVAYALIQTSDSLAQNVAATLETFKPAVAGTGLDILIIELPNDFARGIGIAFEGLLIGGLPTGVLAFVLAWRYRGARWSRTWSDVFFAGSVFQLCNVCFVAFLLVLLFLTVGNPFLYAWAAVAAAGLTAYVVFSAAALFCWQSLRAPVAAHDSLFQS